MKNLADMIVVMQSCERGEAIQCARNEAGREPLWQDCPAWPEWNWMQWDYRVAPKRPREFTVILNNGEPVSVHDPDKQLIDITADCPINKIKVLRVREVIE